MFENPSIAGSWPALCDRIDNAHVLTRWASVEPALGSIASAQDLPAAVAVTVDPDRRDGVFGALVRLAAADADASTDGDVVSVLLHLLSPGAFAVARSLNGLCEDPIRVVVAELAVRIRTFPVHRRTRAFAANLLMDTRRVLVRELVPVASPVADLGEQLDHATDRHGGRGLMVHGPYDDPGLDLVDVLTWAQRTGVVTGPEVALLVDIAYAREAGGPAQLRIAAEHRINERTLRRRQERALTRLRAASGAYLAACA